MNVSDKILKGRRYHRFTDFSTIHAIKRRETALASRKRDVTVAQPVWVR
jgi:hypothetical protein